MCFDPVSLFAGAGSLIKGVTSTLGGVSSALSAGAGLLGAYATFQNGQAQRKALNEQSLQEEQAARERLEQGREESERRRRAGAIQLGNQRAALAANGIDVEGSLAIDLLDDSQSIIDDDAFSIRENARRGAQGLSQRAANSRQAGANAASQGTFGAISTILTTGAKVGSKFKHFNRPTSTDPWSGLRPTGAY